MHLKELFNENNDAQSGSLLTHSHIHPAFNSPGSRSGPFQVSQLLVRNDCGRSFKADPSKTSQCGRGPRTTGADRRIDVVAAATLSLLAASRADYSDPLL